MKKETTVTRQSDTLNKGHIADLSATEMPLVRIIILVITSVLNYVTLDMDVFNEMHFNTIIYRH
jgi:hypothetical protein